MRFAHSQAPTTFDAVPSPDMASKHADSVWPVWLDEQHCKRKMKHVLFPPISKHLISS